MARTAGKRQEARKRPEPSESSAPVKRPLPTVDDPQESRFNTKTLMIIGGAAVVVAMIVAIAAGLANETPIEDTMPADVEVTVEGERLAPFDLNSADPTLGQPAPSVTAVDFDGNPASITVGDGTPKAIVFLAHWCQHCQAEVPALQSYINANGLPEGVDLVSVATSYTSARPNYPPSLWLQRENWTVPVVVDDQQSSISTAFGLTSFPYYVFVDGAGNVVSRVSGSQAPETIVEFMRQLAG